jgi:hypothetical protein
MLSDEQYQVQTSQSVCDAFQAIEQKPFDAYVFGLQVAGRFRTWCCGADSVERERSSDHCERARRKTIYTEGHKGHEDNPMFISLCASVICRSENPVNSPL